MRLLKDESYLEEETQEHCLEMLYLDALYWHLIHNGYTFKRAELEIFLRTSNRRG